MVGYFGDLLLTLIPLAAAYFLHGCPPDAINFPLLLIGALAALVLVVFRKRVLHAVLVPILFVMTLAATLTKVL
jgi:hypothetical protein